MAIMLAICTGFVPAAVTGSPVLLFIGLLIVLVAVIGRSKTASASREK